MATSTLGSGTLVLAGTTSGTTTVTATAVAGTTTLTLPAATDTLVGKATTDTLTNKTLTGAVMNGTLGATTPSTGAFTTLTSTSASSFATSSGSVGIGTSSPTNPLHIVSNTVSQLNVAASSGNTNAQINLEPTGTGIALIGPANSVAFAFRTNNTERMRIDTSGNLLVGATNASQVGILRVVSASAEAGTIATFGYDTNGSSVYILEAKATGQNNAGTAMLVLKNTSTSRSINAAGTINASGADYAEYMTKAGNFTIAKGDVVGIDAQGNLTNVFDNAVSFMVKSTDPSYVGGDSWGSEEAIGLSMPKKPSQRQVTEEVEAEADEEFAVRFAQYEADQSAFDAALEAARQRVDRIAFAGQVPVNVMGATAGQYIIPVNDSGAIKGEAVSNPTFEQYQIAVGKVIAIESDGRAKIIVKVA